MAGFNENADKKIKISSKPNAVTIEAIKEVQQMKSGAVTDKTSYDDVDKMISDIKPLCYAGRFLLYSTLLLSFCYRLKFLQFGAIIKILFLEKIPERVKIWDIYLKQHSTSTIFSV